MWHWIMGLSSVRVIHNSKITYERRTMQSAEEGKPPVIDWDRVVTRCLGPKKG